MKALRRRYGHANKPFIHIGHGYRVTDAYAGKLARDVGAKLPGHGHELAVVLPNGPSAWLARTPVHTDVYGFKAPARGWVWYVHPRGSTHERAFFEYVR